MFLECNICKKPFEISLQNKKYIIQGEEFVCSPLCIGKWIIKNKNCLCSEPLKYRKLDYNLIHDGCGFDVIKYRSEYERGVAIFLYWSMFLPFGYEIYGFKLSVGTYTPDFWVTGNVFLEVKGAMSIGWKLKLKRFRKEYPKIKLLVIPWVLHKQFYSLIPRGVVK